MTPRTEAALSLRSVGARRGGSAAASSGPAPGLGRNKEALSSLRPGFVAGWTGVRSCCGAGNAIYYCLFCRGWDFRAFAGPPGSPAEPAGAVCLSAPLCPSLLIFPGVSPCSFNSLHPIPCFSAALPSWNLGWGQGTALTELPRPRCLLLRSPVLSVQLGRSLAWVWGSVPDVPLASCLWKDALRIQVLGGVLGDLAGGIAFPLPVRSLPVAPGKAEKNVNFGKTSLPSQTAQLPCMGPSACG